MNPEQPPRLRQQFYDRIEQVNRELAQVREKVELMREQVRADKSDGAKELADFARSPQAPRELRAIQRRVDSGELTWEQALTGEIDDDDIHRLRASMRASFASAATLFEKADEISRTEGVSGQEATELAIRELQREKGNNHG